VSAILAAHGLLAYVIESSREQPMTELLFRLYLWHTVDMIPFLDIWKVYDIKPPVRPDNFWAQSIILAFRTAIVGFAISVIAQRLKFNDDAPEGAGAVNQAHAADSVERPAVSKV
jgi:hypothetical protein